MNRFILFVGGMIIWLSLFGYLFFIEKEFIQKMVCAFVLVVSQIFFLGLENTIHNRNINKIEKLIE